jgi:phage/plasmid-associated DNA primase
MDEFERMTPKLGREALNLGRENPKLGMKKGGAVKKMASGGKVSSASKRADGCAIRGKTKGRMI